MFNNFKKGVREILCPNSKISVKSLTMLISSVLGFILGIMLGVCLIIDTVKDGKIDSDLYGASAFVVSLSVLVLASGVPRTLVDKTTASLTERIVKGKDNNTEESTEETSE